MILSNEQIDKQKEAHVELGCAFRHKDWDQDRASFSGPMNKWTGLGICMLKAMFQPNIFGT